MGCQKNFSTEHEEYSPGFTRSYTVDLSECPPGAERLEVYGYVTTRNRSRPIEPRDRVEFNILQGGGLIGESDEGRVVIDPAPSPSVLQVDVTNRHHKDQVLRMRCVLVYLPSNAQEAENT